MVHKNNLTKAQIGEFIDIIRDYLQKYSISQSELARMASISETSVNNVMCKKSHRIDFVHSIACALNIQEILDVVDIRPKNMNDSTELYVAITQIVKDAVNRTHYELENISMLGEISHAIYNMISSDSLPFKNSKDLTLYVEALLHCHKYLRNFNIDLFNTLQQQNPDTIEVL